MSFLWPRLRQTRQREDDASSTVFSRRQRQGERRGGGEKKGGGGGVAVLQLDAPCLLLLLSVPPPPPPQHTRSLTYPYTRPPQAREKSEEVKLKLDTLCYTLAFPDFAPPPPPPPPTHTHTHSPVQTPSPGTEKEMLSYNWMRHSTLASLPLPLSQPFPSGSRGASIRQSSP